MPVIGQGFCVGVFRAPTGQIGERRGDPAVCGVFRTFSLSLTGKQVFTGQKKENHLIRASFLYIIPFRGTFGGVKLFKLRIDFLNGIV